MLAPFLLFGRFAGVKVDRLSVAASWSPPTWAAPCCSVSSRPPPGSANCASSCCTRSHPSPAGLRRRWRS